MAQNVLSLLTQSLYLSGVVSKDFNQPTSNQNEDALMCLNDILSEKSVDDAMNPYYTKYEFDAEAGEQEYFIDNLIQVDTLTFINGSVRMPMQYVARDAYYGETRAVNTDSMPYMYYYERERGGARLYIYYPPNQAYPFTLWGKFGLDSEVGYFDDLSAVYDRFYLAYLKAAVAERLCDYYAITVPRQLEKLLVQYDVVFSNQISPPDLTVTGMSVFGRYVWPNWGFINIGNQGWLP